MLILGLAMPLLAAGGWLWWLYLSDRFEREPWGLILKVVAAGAGAGLVSLGAARWLLPDLAGGQLTLSALQALLHVGMLAGLLGGFPYRNPNWNEPFDGLVYGGAAGVGYGLLFTLPALMGNAAAGFRVAIFSMPVYMLVGIILGHHLSRARFGWPGAGRSPLAWLRGISLSFLFLLAIDLALAAGGEVVSGPNMLAGLMAYGANTLAWMVAMRAMDQSSSGEGLPGGAPGLTLDPAACRACGSGYPVGAAYCTGCGRPVSGQARGGRTTQAQKEA